MKNTVRRAANGGGSPEDHAILEAEYQRNPKPDKSARTSIVDRVSLGEKEVQERCQENKYTIQAVNELDLVPESPAE